MATTDIGTDDLQQKVIVLTKAGNISGAVEQIRNLNSSERQLEFCRKLLQSTVMTDLYRIILTPENANTGSLALDRDIAPAIARASTSTC